MDGLHRDPDSQAILLLCASFDTARSPEAPLNAAEYHALARWLHTHQLRPADLLGRSSIQHLPQSHELPMNAERITRLIARRDAMATAVAQWSSNSIWVISRSSPHYPQRLKSRLGAVAPPILYGVGNHTLLTGGGLAIVGSRDADAAALAWTRRLGTRCSEQGLQVVSGVARGVDRTAMCAALDTGGTAVGVLAERLLTIAHSALYRPALHAGRLALVTASDPDADFSVQRAMGRNKYIYTLSDYALVVSTALNHGGTWHGATENLSHGWVPLLARSGEAVPEGNKRLVKMGAVLLEEAVLGGQGQLRDVFVQHIGETRLPLLAE